MTTFKATWTDRSRPTTITLPSGEVKTVKYMRDGLILFTDNSSASYERLDVFSAIIALNESWEEAKGAVADYWSRVSGV